MSLGQRLSRLEGRLEDPACELCRRVEIVDLAHGEEPPPLPPCPRDCGRTRRIVVHRTRRDEA